MPRRGSGRVAEYLKTSLWVVPAAAALGSVGLAIGTIAIDDALGGHPLGERLFPGGLDAARGLLSTIAASIITFLGVVFSITMVVLQLASSRFSPRVLRTFLEDRTSKLTMALFVATFFYAMLVLRTLPDPGAGGQAPGLPAISISVALALVVASVGMFIRYVDHMARAIRVSHIAKTASEDAREAIDRVHPMDDDEAERWSPPGPPDAVVEVPAGGYFDTIDVEELVERAADADSVVALRRRRGEYLPAGSAWADIHGALEPRRVVPHLHVAEERTMAQDPAFALRQLVDIAERSLSPGTIDPTSAVQAFDRIHDLLRELVRRPLPDRQVMRDGDGRVRLVVPSFTWDDYLALATDEIVQYGRRSIQTMARARSILEDVHDVAPPHRRPSIRERLHRLPQVPDPYATEDADAGLAS